MSQLDQFESLFRSAAKVRYHFNSLSLNRWLIVTDLDGEKSQGFREQVESFLDPLSADPSLCVEVLTADKSISVEALLTKSQNFQADLIITYRNLHSDGWKWPYSLGEHLDVLTQHTDIPVLVMPHPLSDPISGHHSSRLESVIAVTDHLTGDDRLVNYAVHFTGSNGQLFLAHVEDQVLLERYLGAISKIATIDTDVARHALPKQLLKEAGDFIQSCREQLKEKGLPIRITDVVRTGHLLAEYKRIIDEHSIDLLVINTKDDDQLAMHGLAHPIAVELRQVPMLLV